MISQKSNIDTIIANNLKKLNRPKIQKLLDNEKIKQVSKNIFNQLLLAELDNNSGSILDIGKNNVKCLNKESVRCKLLVQYLNIKDDLKIMSLTHLPFSEKISKQTKEILSSTLFLFNHTLKVK